MLNTLESCPVYGQYPIHCYLHFEFLTKRQEVGLTRLSSIHQLSLNCCQLFPVMEILQLNHNVFRYR